MTAALDRPDRPVSVVAPDPAVRWLAVLALALGGFAIGTTEFVAMGLLPDIASSLNVTEPTAGHVISAYAMGVVIGAPIIAALAARVPRKILLLTLMGVFTLGSSASAPVSLGASQQGTDDWFKGAIDEVRLYNRALSPSEIQADMRTPIP